jgi:hypothetical protein
MRDRLAYKRGPSREKCEIARKGLLVIKRTKPRLDPCFDSYFLGFGASNADAFTVEE